MQDVIAATIAEVSTVLLGKRHQIKLALTCFLSQGHLLIEDLPGMGKTTLSQALAQVMNLSYNRIQFTSDLLPADILGVSTFDKDSGNFSFHPGPIFSQLVLADEINRTTPKSQSALLEAMEERQVTVEGETRELPQPFFFIATQNPSTQAGTFPLPESQLDRFLMRIELGYPDAEAERALLKGEDRRAVLTRVKPRWMHRIFGTCSMRVTRSRYPRHSLTMFSGSFSTPVRPRSLPTDCPPVGRWHCSVVRAVGHLSRTAVTSYPKMCRRYCPL